MTVLVKQKNLIWRIKLGIQLPTARGAQSGIGFDHNNNSTNLFVQVQQIMYSPTYSLFVSNFRLVLGLLYCLLAQVKTLQGGNYYFDNKIRVNEGL